MRKRDKDCLLIQGFEVRGGFVFKSDHNNLLFCSSQTLVPHPDVEESSLKAHTTEQKSKRMRSRLVKKMKRRMC
jgi:hypothetical protein